jgi:hypothetical protein
MAKIKILFDEQPPNTRLGYTKAAEFVSRKWGKVWTLEALR